MLAYRFLSDNYRENDRIYLFGAVHPYDWKHYRVWTGESVQGFLEVHIKSGVWRLWSTMWASGHRFTVDESDADATAISGLRLAYSTEETRHKYHCTLLVYIPRNDFADRWYSAYELYTSLGKNVGIVRCSADCLSRNLTQNIIHHAEAYFACEKVQEGFLKDRSYTLRRSMVGQMCNFPLFYHAWRILSKGYRFVRRDHTQKGLSEHDWRYESRLLFPACTCPRWATSQISPRIRIRWTRFKGRGRENGKWASARERSMVCGRSLRYVRHFHTNWWLLLRLKPDCNSGGRRGVNQNLIPDDIDPALEWMSAEASSLGVRMMSFREKAKDERFYDVIRIAGRSKTSRKGSKPGTNGYQSQPDGRVRDSLSTFSPWWLLEGIFVKRISYERDDGNERLWVTFVYCTMHYSYSWNRPHLGKGRPIASGQKIHSSVRYRRATYKPRATLKTVNDYTSNEQGETMQKMWPKLNELKVKSLPNEYE